tara:strand:- start:10509 stop:10859 length:351 start_codon:yes stop_codon:yes gene_type:complete
MTRFKDFGVGKALEEKEPVTFKLHDEDFTCVPHLQGKVLLDLIAKSASTEASDSAVIITEFFDAVLIEESAKRFDTLLHDQEKIVHVETLSEIVAWLMTEYSSRPNQLPEDSSAGQ